MNLSSRRKLLDKFGRVAAAALALPTGDEAAKLQSPSPGPPGRKLKVVVAGGHPGDPEYGCGGTVARYADLGHEVVLLYLNDGVPAGTPKDGVRVAEAGKACEVLNARARFAGQVDGDAIVDRAHYEAFGKLLAAERPDVVFAHWPIDNHADHRA